MRSNPSRSAWRAEATGSESGRAAAETAMPKRTALPIDAPSIPSMEPPLRMNLFRAGRSHGPDPGIADTEPPVAIRGQLEALRPRSLLAVLVAEDLEQRPMLFSAQAELHLLGFVGEVVRHHHGPAHGLEPEGEHRLGPGLEGLPRPNAELGAFLARADHPFHPVQLRTGVAPLIGHVDLAVAERTPGDDRSPQLVPVGRGEARVPIR